MRLFAARGGASASACSRRPTGCGARSCGDEVTYVVTRNIQYTNVCYFRCGFCAFSKGKLAENLRGPAYLVPARGDRPARPRGVGARARPRSASRAASTRRSRATTTPRSSRRSRTRCPGSTSTPSRRSRSGRAPRRSGLDLDDLPRASARPRARLAAGHGRRDPRRRGAGGHLPGQGDDRAVARGARGRAPGRASLERDDHVRPRRAAARTGRATSSARASSRRGPGGFTEFVPLPFVPMEAPIYLQGPRAPRADLRRGAARCTPSRGSRCTR